MLFVDYFVIALAIPVCLFGLFIVFTNYYIIFVQKHGSLSPLVGGVLIAIALWMVNPQFHWSIFLLPYIIDPGCIFVFAATFYYHWKEWRAKNRADKLVAPED